MKNKTTALILSILVGGLGVDRFYLGYTGMGILKLLTGGCFGVLWLIDLINIATGKLGPADGSPTTTAQPPRRPRPLHRQATPPMS
ncbi:MAG: TM2 domain-containing protein [Oscillospiraceae bacterium]